MLLTFIGLWKKETKVDIRREKVDIIVPISFATFPDRLVKGTKMNLEWAIDFQRVMYPKARIAFSSCSYPFLGAEKIEDELRTEICEEAGIEPIVAVSMLNTVDEAMNIAEKLRETGINTKKILIITGEIHSRSTDYIYRKVFPDADIFIRCIPHEFEIEHEHLVLSQRTMGQWVFSNIARQIALRILPLKLVRQIKRKAQT